MADLDMNKMNYDKYSKNFLENGTTLIPFEHGPFSKKDIDKLSLLCEKVEKEFIKVGDAGEPNHLLVGRFMTDVMKPEVVDNPYSNDLIKIIYNDELTSYVSNIIKVNGKFFLRRAQFNQIDQNCFVGYHLDTDSNPDYLVACVVQLGEKFEGGHYRVYQKDKNFIDYSPSYGSFIISNCTFPHEVTKVKAGNRKSLVFFLSKEKGPNKRNV